VFPDGSECEEWAYFRGDCQPGDSLAWKELTNTPDPTSAPSSAYDGWNFLRNEELGFSFRYPPEYELVVDRTKAANVIISGPVMNNDSRPSITLSYPTDREDFRPPEGTDLEAWLIEHYLIAAGKGEPLGEIRQDDIEIAQATAVHLRFERSPQSYAYDRFYFAHAGQLYMIVIGHTGDKEDWDLYNLFLESFKFDD